MNVRIAGTVRTPPHDMIVSFAIALIRDVRRFPRRVGRVSAPGGGVLR